MNDDDFKLFARVLKEKSGMSLARDKIYLLESRLKPVIEKYKCGSLEGLAVLLRDTGNNLLIYELIEAMTTHETLFFRDDRPFSYFRTALMPALLQARQTEKKLRFWSAACSTGQEPYSIAMTVSELLAGQTGWSIDILATDISNIVIEQARNGTYGQFEIQRGLPVQMLVTHFTRNGAQWQVNEKIRRMVRFETFNLIQSMEKFGMFDVIFCRNVLIYFDEPTKAKVLQNISRRLTPEGYLLLGGAESALCANESLALEGKCPGLYKPVVLPNSSPPAAIQIIGTVQSSAG